MQSHARRFSPDDGFPPRTDEHEALRRRLAELEQELAGQEDAHTHDRLELHRQHVRESGVWHRARREMEDCLAKQQAELEVLRHASREGRLERQTLRCELALAREVEESTRAYCDRLEADLRVLNGGRKPSFEI